jgi:DEAD/DEAH box helicase domain-containing protein
VHVPTRGARDRSPDFSLASWSTRMQVTEPEEHVLVLEFAENSRGKKNENNPFVLFLGSKIDVIDSKI